MVQSGIVLTGLVLHATIGIFAIRCNGADLSDFLPMPDDLTAEPFLKLWEHKVFALLLAEGRITEKVVEQMRSWKHSGFSVHKSVYLPAGDQAAIQRLLHCRFFTISPVVS